MADSNDPQGEYFKDQMRAKAADARRMRMKYERCPICERLCYPTWPDNLRLAHVCEKDETIDWLDLFACLTFTDKESTK